MGEVGYKKPPKHSQFGQPNGNPMGKTSAQKKMEYENAEKAVALRARLLDAAIESLDGIDGGEGMSAAEVMAHIEPAMLKLIKDSEDRGLGAPVQPIISPDGSMTPSVVEIRGVAASPDDKADD